MPANRKQEYSLDLLATVSQYNSGTFCLYFFLQRTTVLLNLIKIEDATKKFKIRPSSPNFALSQPYHFSQTQTGTTVLCILALPKKQQNSQPQSETAHTKQLLFEEQ
jgi:hypothetical protein